jgi:hypothetical protein
MKQKLEEAIAAAVQGQLHEERVREIPRNQSNQWKSTRVRKKALNPTAEIVFENQVHSVCNKITESKHKNSTHAHHHEFDADMVVSTF